MTRASYIQSLQELQETVLSLGSMVEKAIGRSVEALKNQDTALAQKVIEGDAAINELRWQIEENAYLLIATQALGSIYRTILRDRNGAGLVLWVVPSSQIYRDTLKALSDRSHGYRVMLEHAVSAVRYFRKHHGRIAAAALFFGLAAEFAAKAVYGSLAAVLESEGFAVDEAQNGIETVTRAIEYTPDLVLLDLNMPHWDGWTAFNKLDRVTPLLPVIVITARPNQYQKAVQLGVDAFMEKPLNIPILLRAIKRLISEDEDRHLHRITNRAFITQLLGKTGS